MTYDYDLIVIGLGPAGMAVAVMGSEMGLRVCGIEKHKVGGECMNVGCIPSKALLRMAKTRSVFDKLEKYELSPCPKPDPQKTFERIQESLTYIADKKTMKIFNKVDMVYQQGAARFVGPHTVEVGEKTYTAKRIFICTGTRPAIPDFPGITDIDGLLTNENLFSLDAVPDSMIVVGGGAIACEMAQAFSRLGTQVTMIIRGPRLMWRECQAATDILEQTFEKEGIRILREQNPTQFEMVDGKINMATDKDETVIADKLLVAAGRKMDYSDMGLDAAGVKTTSRGAIRVNTYLQTTKGHIYACGDCNGYAQFSHAAMHQGMIALMNSMAPWPFKKKYKDYVVPWTVFTEPQISHVGPRQTQLDDDGVDYEVIAQKYEDYGAAIAESIDVGFVQSLASPKTGRIYNATIVGEGSGEMINEWALAVQKKMRLFDIMMLQHSFPTMGFLTKRVGETWMMNRMKSPFLKKLCKFFY